MAEPCQVYSRGMKCKINRVISMPGNFQLTNKLTKNKTKANIYNFSGLPQHDRTKILPKMCPPVVETYSRALL